MLIPQLYLKMQNLFAVADKSEMTRFNYARMNWSYSHFMKFFAFNFIERIIIHDF